MISHYTYPFFFTVTPSTQIYTLSLHDALPIYRNLKLHLPELAVGDQVLARDRLPVHNNLDRYFARGSYARSFHVPERFLDRKSTRLNSSHSQISYAVFCLKKKTDRA